MKCGCRRRGLFGRRRKRQADDEGNDNEVELDISDLP